MHLTEEVAVLDGKRMRLETIYANGKDSVLVQDDAAMLLPARNLKTLRIGEVNQLAVFFRINHDKDSCSIPTLLFMGVSEIGLKTFYWISKECYCCLCE
jgi:hypothetical protein